MKIKFYKNFIFISLTILVFCSLFNVKVNQINNSSKALLKETLSFKSLEINNYFFSFIFFNLNNWENENENDVNEENEKENENFKSENFLHLFGEDTINQFNLIYFDFFKKLKSKSLHYNILKSNTPLVILYHTLKISYL